MVPAVVPVVAMPRADPARAVIGPDHPAVAVRIIVIGRRVVEAPVEVVPECADRREQRAGRNWI